jgi:thiopeptide-type bacteriocin biosynthesis protein
VTDWASWHLHLGTMARSAYDRVVLDVVGPAADSVPGRLWFFVRYWQAGPHLRLRVAGLDADERLAVERLLRGRLAVAGVPAADEEPVRPETYRAGAEPLAAVGELHGPLAMRALLPAGVYRDAYEPELDRYGGPAVMAASEHLFHLSSELVLRCLRTGPTDATRAGLAARATMCAAAALGGPAEQVEFYRQGAAVQRSLILGYGYTADQLDRVDTAIRAAVDARRPALRGPVPVGPLQPFCVAVADLTQRLRARTPEHVGRILLSHTHMLHNRLGLTMPEELQTYLRLTHLHAVRS